MSLLIVLDYEQNMNVELTGDRFRISFQQIVKNMARTKEARRSLEGVTFAARVRQLSFGGVMKPMPYSKGIIKLREILCSEHRSRLKHVFKKTPYWRFRKRLSLI